MAVKILMVCLGNICRSPLAEGIFSDVLSDLEVDVDSAGTAAYHAGESPDPRSVAIALRNGLDISKQRARQFQTSDYDRFDHILVMDRENLSNVLRLAPSEDHARKVRLIMEFAGDHELQEVPDPYYGGREGFQLVYQMLKDAAYGFRKSLMQ